MGKDPAFLMYPGDWLGGTMGMTFELRGAYFHLLMLQFFRGHMTLLLIYHEVGELWEHLKEKFIQDEAGLWYNARLEEEQYKRQKFSQSRRNNLAGKNQHTPKVKEIIKSNSHSTTHMTSHMENEIENVNISVDGTKLTEIQKQKRFDAISTEMIASGTWQNDVAIFIGKSPDEVEKLLTEFLRMIKVSQHFQNEINEVKRYFGNWAKKQVSNPTLLPTPTKNSNIPWT